MRRMLWLACAGALAGLLAPASADAGVLDVFQRLADRALSPAPLVPTTAPRRLRPIDRSLDIGTTVHRRAYALRLAWRRASVVLSGGDYRNVRAALRDNRGDRRRTTRVRGHRGFVLTRPRGDLRQLVWSEGGRVYVIGTGTPRKVSLRQLRSIAAGLERLRGHYLGGSSDPQKSSYAQVATTAHTITVHLEFEASCTSTPRAGGADVVLAPLRGNSFSFDIASTRRGSAPWTGSFSGTVTDDAVTVDYEVSGTIDGESCSGSETITAPRSR